MAHYVIRFARNAGIVALFVVAATLGILSGVLFAYAGDLPQISAPDNYAPNTITRVYAADGQTSGEFATERRLAIGYDDIAPRLRQAIISWKTGLRAALRSQHLGIRHRPREVPAREGPMAGRPCAPPAQAPSSAAHVLPGVAEMGASRAQIKNDRHQIEARTARIRPTIRTVLFGHGTSASGASRLLREVGQG